MKRGQDDLIRVGRDNQASRGATVARLNGQVYTPMALARDVVARLDMRPNTRWLDPACGDGIFLAALRERAKREGIAGVHVEGWDLDVAALDAARARCAEVGPVVLRHTDALDRDDTFDGVVGNPPYVEAKRMPDALKAKVKARCPVAARGAFDLYAAFVERSVHWVGEGGQIALIVPNRILCTASPARLRERLAGVASVEATDLSKDDVFGAAAAVYPVVLSLKTGAPGPYTFRSEGAAVAFGEDILERTGGVFPTPTCASGAAWLSRVLSDPRFTPIGQRFDVRWTVSFHRAGLRDTFVFDHRPASPHARRFLGGGRYSGNRELAPFRTDWAGWWIDHDEARARAEKNHLPPLALFEDPKVVIAQNVKRLRAAMDREGFVLKDTFLLARGGEAHDLAWLTLLLNSATFHVLFSQLYGGTRKRGGYLHVLPRYLAPMPIPPTPPDASELHASVCAGDLSPEAVEARIREAYGVTADEAAWLATQAVPEP